MDVIRVSLGRATPEFYEGVADLDHPAVEWPGVVNASNRIAIPSRTRVIP